MRRRFIRRVVVGAFAIGLTLVILVGGLAGLVATLVRSSWIGGLTGLAVAVLLAVVAARLVRSLRLATAPLADLVEAAGRVEAGELGVEVDERGPSEVRSLIRSFNAMSARLAATEEQRRSLLADVSHELRTPLTLIQGNVEAMLDGLYPADREHLERIRAVTAHLEQLIDDLRTLSLADAGALTLDREPSDLGAIASAIADEFRPQAAAAGVTLAVEVQPRLPEQEVDPRRIRQVIANLVANAIRHTPDGGTVTLRVAAEPAGVRLEVADTGSGMTAEQAAHAFDRFWKAGETAGAGLGLAIVRDLVGLHGGTVDLESEGGRGTTVTCRFPV